MPTPETRRRVGKITLPTGVEYSLVLADRNDAYQPSYSPVWPQQEEVPGTAKLAETLTRTWHITRWSGGEGDDLWDPSSSRYNTSDNVIPIPTMGEGLVLAPYQHKTRRADALLFTGGLRLGIGLGSLYAVADNTVHAWSLATNTWDSAGTATGAGGAEACSICDAGDGTNLYIAYLNNNTIRRVAPGGANSEYYATGTFTYDPIVESYDSRLFALDGDDLYEILAANTRQQVAETNSYGDNYLTGDYRHTYQRLTTTDVGLCWYTVADNGQVYLWEYNVADDLDARIGKLPVDGCYPYSIAWANGFVFVAFRYASAHNQKGDAYIYYQRGGQRGVAGPVRNPASSASMPIRLAGMVGDDLLFFYNGYLWGYNLSSGGIVCKANSTTTDSSAIYDAITWGKDAFISNVDGAAVVERFDTSLYTTDGGYLEQGRWDFGYLGFKKTLIDVRVVTEPLPTNTTVTMAVSVDGGSYTNLTGTFTGDDAATSYLWSASTSSSSITGYDFELRIGLDTSDTAYTPTIRSITARATSATKRRTWLILLDPTTVVGGLEGISPRSVDRLTDLKAVAEYAGVVKFTNPWEGEAWDAPSEHDVIVAEVALTHAEPDRPGVVGLSMWDTVYA